MVELPTRIGISGLGLVGGSLALALREAMPEVELWGCDPNPDSRAMGAESGAFEKVQARLAPVARAVELLVLAGPVSVILGDLDRLARIDGLDLLVTDVGSTKARIVERAQSLPPRVRFVGGHPIAGSEQSGFAAADPLLFENAVYVLTPPPMVSPNGEEVGLLKKLVGRIGARALVLDAASHDRILACTSHLPQLVAVALANTVADLELEYPEAPALVGRGFVDLTRIASSSYSMWGPVVSSNVEATRLAAQAFSQHLEGAFSPDLGESAFARAAQLKSTVDAHVGGASSRGADIMVVLRDDRQALAELTRLLSDAGLDILDIGLLRARQGAWRAFRLTLPSEGERTRALAVLEEAGLVARGRG